MAAAAQAQIASPAVAAAAAEAPTKHPKLKDVPARPTGVRSQAAWRAAILGLRGEGQRTTTLSAAEPWTLSGTDGWAERERAQTVPPPPETTPSEGDTEAFLERMQAEATPPPPKKHRGR